jgi:ornithine cyclodeaminase/alanine dehydrogenase-like protein (mu-crystallin family)
VSVALVVADALHGHTAEAAALTQAHVLIVSDALHATLSDLISLQIPGRTLSVGHRTISVAAGGRTITVATASNGRNIKVH